MLNSPLELYISKSGGTWSNIESNVTIRATNSFLSKCLSDNSKEEKKKETKCCARRVTKVWFCTALIFHIWQGLQWLQWTTNGEFVELFKFATKKSFLRHRCPGRGRQKWMFHYEHGLHLIKFWANQNLGEFRNGLIKKLKRCIKTNSHLPHQFLIWLCSSWVWSQI